MRRSLLRLALNVFFYSIPTVLMFLVLGGWWTITPKFQFTRENTENNANQLVIDTTCDNSAILVKGPMAYEVWDINTGRTLFEVPVPLSVTNWKGISFFDGNNSLLTVDALNKVATIYDLTRSGAKREIKLPASIPWENVKTACLKEFRTLFLSDGFGGWWVVDVENGASLNSFHTAEGVFCGCDNRAHIFTSDFDHRTLKCLNAENGEQLWELAFGASRIVRVTPNPTGNFARLLVLDAAWKSTLKFEHSFDTHQEIIESSTGRRVLVEPVAIRNEDYESTRVPVDGLWHKASRDMFRPFDLNATMAAWINADVSEGPFSLWTAKANDKEVVGNVTSLALDFTKPLNEYYITPTIVDDSTIALVGSIDMAPSQSQMLLEQLPQSVHDSIQQIIGSVKPQTRFKILFFNPAQPAETARTFTIDQLAEAKDGAPNLTHQVCANGKYLICRTSFEQSATLRFCVYDLPMRSSWLTRLALSCLPSLALFLLLSIKRYLQHRWATRRSSHSRNISPPLPITAR